MLSLLFSRHVALSLHEVSCVAGTSDCLQAILVAKEGTKIACRQPLVPLKGMDDSLLKSQQSIQCLGCCNHMI